MKFTLEQKRTGKVKASMAVEVEVDDVFKLLTRTYMERPEDKGCVDLGPLDHDGIARALTETLQYELSEVHVDMEFRWLDGLYRFGVNWEGPAREKPPKGVDWCNVGDTDMRHGYTVKWATVEEIRAALPPRVVKALDLLNKEAGTIELPSTW